MYFGPPTALHGKIASWFTGTEQDLQTLCSSSVDGLLASAPEREDDGRIVAALLPHAGY